MKPDRELLELADKAAGIPYKALPHSGSCWEKWDPLNDDGDALRLAVKLGLFMRAAVREIPRDEYDAEPYAATRRAITRAAAAIGERE